MFKAGANKKDQAVIANMGKDGATAAAISKHLKIDKGVVERFLNPPKKKAGK